MAMTAAASLPVRMATMALPCKTLFRGMASGFLVNQPKYQFLKVVNGKIEDSKKPVFLGSRNPGTELGGL